MARLGGLDQHGRLLALGILHVVQHRLRRQVIVPHVVVHHLVDPLGLARRGVDGDDGRAEFFLDGVAVAAPVVGRAVTGRQVQQVQGLVVGRHGPHVRRFQGELVLRRRGIGALGRAHVPGPGQFTRQHVERAHGAGRLAGHDIAHPAAHHRQVAHDDRQRGGVVALAVFRRTHAFLQVDVALVAEILAQGARVRIEGEQAGIDGRHEDALAALRLWRIRCLDGRAQAGVLVDVMVADAAARHVFRALGVRVEFPQRLARVGVQGRHQVFRRAGIQHIANLQRRVFIDAGAGARRAAARPVSPGHLQVLDVVRRDLRVGSKAGARGAAAKEFPVLRRAVCRLRAGKRARCGARVGDHAVREERGDEGGEQGREQAESAPVGHALLAQGTARQGGPHPQAEHQDHGRDDHPRQQFPVAELPDLVQGPRAGGDEDDDGQRRAAAFFQEEEHGQKQIGEAGDQVIA